MMRSWTTAWARAGAVVLLFMAASEGMAQPPPRPASGSADTGQHMLPRPEARAGGMGDLPGGGRPNADPMQMMLNSPELRQELGLTDLQLRKLERIDGDFRTKQAELLIKLAKPETAQSAQDALQMHQEANRGMVARVLERRQLNRLQEIMLQIGGVCSAVRDENVAQALRLQPQQMQKVGQICNGLNAQVPPPPNGNAKERCASIEKARVRFDQARAAAEAEIDKVLLVEQRRTLVAMSGRPFQMPPPRVPECR